MKLTGYHGTTIKSAKSIEREGFNDSCKPKEWMGTGVYFFGDCGPLSGFDDARNFPINVGVNGCKIEPKYVAVITADIESERYFDQMGEHRKGFEYLRHETLQLHLRSSKKLQTFRDYMVFDRLRKKSREKGTEFDFIRAFFDGSKPLGYPNYCVAIPQVQICVINKDCIEITSINEG